MDIRVGISKTGLGLFAFRDFSPGEQIVEYIGERVVGAESARREKEGNRYLFEIDATTSIDGSTRKNIARYVNHSCDPNAEVRILKGRIFFFARRDIASGDEITINYGISYFNDFIKPVGCTCGAEKHLGQK